MRLIDGDALKNNMFSYAAPEMVWDRGDIEHKINEMPTVDAIPVEWLAERAYDTSRAPMYRRYARMMIDEWQREQEAQDG